MIKSSQISFGHFSLCVSGLDPFAISDLPFSPNCIRSDKDVGGMLKHFRELVFFKGGNIFQKQQPKKKSLLPIFSPLLLTFPIETGRV